MHLLLWRGQGLIKFDQNFFELRTLSQICHHCSLYLNYLSEISGRSPCETWKTSLQEIRSDGYRCFDMNLINLVLGCSFLLIPLTFTKSLTDYCILLKIYVEQPTLCKAIHHYRWLGPRNSVYWRMDCGTWRRRRTYRCTVANTNFRYLACTISLQWHPVL